MQKDTGGCSASRKENPEPTQISTAGAGQAHDGIEFAVGNYNNSDVDG
jgi:hypothetical protein